jgi:hypothetical protein
LFYNVRLCHPSSPFSPPSSLLPPPSSLGHPSFSDNILHHHTPHNRTQLPY